MRPGLSKPVDDHQVLLSREDFCRIDIGQKTIVVGLHVNPLQFEVVSRRDDFSYIDESRLIDKNKSVLEVAGILDFVSSWCQW